MVTDQGGRGADVARPAQKSKELLADKGYDAGWFRAAPRKARHRRLHPIEIQSEGRHPP